MTRADLQRILRPFRRTLLLAAGALTARTDQLEAKEYELRLRPPLQPPPPPR
jgi:hypothetical protein